MKTNSEINEWIQEATGKEKLRRMVEMDALTFGFGGGLKLPDSSKFFINASSLGLKSGCSQLYITGLPN